MVQAVQRKQRKINFITLHPLFQNAKGKIFTITAKNNEKMEDIQNHSKIIQQKIKKKVKNISRKIISVKRIKTESLGNMYEVLI